VLALIAVTPLAIAGCGSAEPRQIAVALNATVLANTEEPVTLAVTPASGATGLPITTEIGATASNGKISEVRLVDATGAAVTGTMRADNSAWVPDRPLGYAATYTATVTALGSLGTPTTATTTFTTMARPGGTRVGSGLYLSNGKTYGVAMPVVVEFESDIPAEARAAVQRRLFVRSDPPQPGLWRWYGARVVMYRPPEYWRPGTTLTVRAALEGLPIGTRFGDKDRSATATIGRDLRVDIDNASKRMTVTQDGQVIKTMPVSLGKSSTPSSSGITVIISKETSTIFDTTRTDGPRGYRVQVAYAQRLTWGGEYIHAAPWSVGDQGSRNVSHGCVNVSTGNASWLFGVTLIGDPVTTRGTERKLDAGNGWTAWNVPWAEFAAGASP
jgi:lipoprotein-anchoring transpeptidase ErfK/SrfK